MTSQLDDESYEDCPPQTQSSQTSFGVGPGATVYGWPSKGGLYVFEACIAIELDFLQLDRFNTTLRSQDPAEEDAHCANMHLLKSFAPTVLENQLLFDGASTSVVRGHFKQWVVTACQQEEGIPPKRLEYAQSGRYRFCLMVNEEALQSVLNAPPVERVNGTDFVILVNGMWVPEMMDEAEIALYDDCPSLSDDYDPVEGCTLHDVGWMKVFYDGAEIDGWADLCDVQDWQLHYYRPPDIGFRLCGWLVATVRSSPRLGRTKDVFT
ncbi:uncharacterized protein CDV56_106255 [Aspergillus thermomutatus]|uniref:Uncharacterized protein n=1 Tax=Aspergillus thermomutatus TaxID=41047 RepID=A0A397GSA2_ASPTH|nr:uncharacterized protein CDV56_106255 [Aspergillus thermomutatus]RHZ53921.1 hypothetical protein CDV56_106255 [Aspergillus thermomutatus]